MLNVVLILMLLSSVYNYIFKRNVYSTLNCGIFAWTGVSSDKFSPFIFNVLGVYNDSRGGDSCGVYFNKNSITGIKTDAKYEALVKSQKLHTTIKPGKYPIVIGHCRKASVGAVSELNVQPTLLRNAAKGDKLMYVQAHNGTITNHKELAKKYGIEIIAEESDSVVMAKLIEKVGFDILLEYEGSAAFVMYFVKEPNVLYVFHGESKVYTMVAEERPLHYIQIPGSGTYISSEAPPLEFIGNGNKATSFKYNIVYKLVGDQVEEFKKVERDKAVKKYVPETNVNQRSFDYYNKRYDGYDDEYYPYKMIPEKTPKKEDLSYLGITKNICCSNIEISPYKVGDDQRIVYQKGFFFKGDKYANGEIATDNWGYCRQSELTPINAVPTFKLYFFHGILLINKDSWEMVTREAFLKGATDGKAFYNEFIFNKMTRILSSSTVFPFTKLTNNPASGYMLPAFVYENDSADRSDTFYKGKFVPLFGDCELHFDNGNLLGFKKLTTRYNIQDLAKDFPELMNLDFGKDTEEEQTFPKDWSCEKCIEQAKWAKGDACLKCTFFANEDKISVDDNDKMISLTHVIATQLAPILDDLESLIGELETSGFEHLVQDPLEILNDANNKLKEITV